MSKLVRFPGLIDIHVHLRDPGQTHKEDFFTGTKAALAGGVTTVIDMPNNKEPILTEKLLRGKNEIAKQKALCDYGLYFGTDGDNINEFENVSNKVIGLKIYLNITTGKLVIEDEEKINKVFKSWPKNKVIVVHAENEMIDFVLDLCRKYENRLHITHISKKKDLEKIIDVKRLNLPVTCDVTPHHLFLTNKDGEYLNGLLQVKPELQSQSDVDYLWDNLSKIDCIASDHAPHTLEEKKAFDPPSGLPELDTMLPLLYTAVRQKRLSNTDLIRLTNTSPQKIFDYKQDKNTYVELDPEEEYQIENENLFTKCGWSPYHGWKVYGKIKRVYIRSQNVYEEGKVLVDRGFGRNIMYQ